MVGERITPIRAGQAEGFPAVYYATDNVAPISCRHAGQNYSGTLEVSLMAITALELDDLTSLIRQAIDGYSGSSAGYVIDIDPGQSGPDDQEDTVYYRRLDFPISAYRLPA